MNFILQAVKFLTVTFSYGPYLASTVHDWACYGVPQVYVVYALARVFS
jgi:hypothetical protein